MNLFLFIVVKLAEWRLCSQAASSLNKDNREEAKHIKILGQRATERVFNI